MDDKMNEGSILEMGNQQVTQMQLAWLAGIWDGEGTISIRRTVQHGGRKNPQYSPRVNMVNTNTGIISEARSILNKLEVKHYFAEKPTGGNSNLNTKVFKQCWSIQIDNMAHALRLLMAIRPYLIGKAFQADCLIEFCDARIQKMYPRKGKSNKQKAYTSREFELVEKIFEANGSIRGTSETTRQDAQRAMIWSDLVRDNERGSETALRSYPRVQVVASG